MSKGQRYLVYERTSRDGEKLFLETAKGVVSELKPENWKHKDPTKHPGARNSSYGFGTMLMSPRSSGN